MTRLRIKPCYLNEMDNTSLRSMLKLSNDRLISQWEIIDKGVAELYIYSLNSEQSAAALQAHSDGFSAVLCNEPVTLESVDIVLKKPLRAKDFANTLNQLEDNIRFSKQAKQVAELAQADSTGKNLESHPSNRSLFSSLAKRLRRHAVKHDLPELTFDLPAQDHQQSESILDPELLRKWLDKLVESDSNKIVRAILSNLTSLNRTKLAKHTRLALLEVYRLPISRLVFDRDLTAVQREINAPTEFLKDINALKLLLDEFALGYKIVIQQDFVAGEHPASEKLYLFAIIRAVELISLQILHAFRHYHSAPKNTFQSLHQLYLYCEAAKVLDTLAITKKLTTERSFIELYNQIMLAAIADPYSLAKFDVLRLYRLMAVAAKNVDISQLNQRQKTSNRSLDVVGQFFVNCSDDSNPVALSQVAIDQRDTPQARIIDPQKAIQQFKQIIADSLASKTQATYDLDSKLLQKVLPQFDTSYVRQYQRVKSKKDRNIKLAAGINAIHSGLENQESAALFEWVMDNQSANGMMASRRSEDIQALSYGDLMGIFEQGLAVKLATIRWLHMANDGTIHIGLQIHPGNPGPVTFIPDGKTDIMSGLLLPEVADIKQPPTIITDKGAYSANRIFRLKNNDDVGSIRALELIDSTLNYEQFSFKKN